MTADELLLKIEKSAPEPVYFLYGKERFYQVEILNRLTRRLITPDNREFNLETYDAKSSSVADWVAAAQTLSFLGGQKLVIVRNLHEASLQATAAQVLIDYLAHPSPDTCLAITADKVDRKIKLHKTLTALKMAVECVAPKEHLLIPWLKKRAASMGYALSHDAARMMVDRVGAKSGILAAELEKAAIFAGENKEIDETITAEVVGHVKLENVFALTDALKNKDAAAAVWLLRNQLDHSEEPLKILGAVSWQFRFIWEVKHYLKNKVPPAQIAEKMKAKPFVVDKALKYTGRFSYRQLRQGFENLFQADHELKTSGKNPRLVMESLILKLCSAR